MKPGDDEVVGYDPRRQRPRLPDIYSCSSIRGSCIVVAFRVRYQGAESASGKA